MIDVVDVRGRGWREERRRREKRYPRFQCMAIFPFVVASNV